MQKKGFFLTWVLAAALAISSVGYSETQEVKMEILYRFSLFYPDTAYKPGCFWRGSGSQKLLKMALAEVDGSEGTVFSKTVSLHAEDTTFGEPLRADLSITAKQQIEADGVRRNLVWLSLQRDQGKIDFENLFIEFTGTDFSPQNGSIGMVRELRDQQPAFDGCYPLAKLTVINIHAN